MTVLPYVPCGWDPTPIPGGPCCDGATTDPAIVEQANAIATAVIFALTGRQFGACPVTVRPCLPQTCDPLQLSRLIYWDSRASRGYNNGNLGVLSFIPTLLNGQIYNLNCGFCPTGCCKCEPSCRVALPGPIQSITNVTKDGVTVAPANYTVYNGNKLAFVTDPAHPEISACPGCQDYDLPAGQVGTWTVTYNIGTPVPNEANFAAGLYALEVAKSLLGDKSCGLPERVQAVTRQGITTVYFDPTKLISMGLTGLTMVDQIVSILNPNRMAEASRVWYPSKYKVQRET